MSVEFEPPSDSVEPWTEDEVNRFNPWDTFVEPLPTPEDMLAAQWSWEHKLDEYRWEMGQ